MAYIAIYWPHPPTFFADLILDGPLVKNVYKLRMMQTGNRIPICAYQEEAGTKSPVDIGIVAVSNQNLVTRSILAEF